MQEITLTQTIEVVARCFGEAELDVRRIVREIRHDANEEAITNDLERDLATRLKSASDDGTIAKAFANDLAHPFSSVDQYRLLEAASGLIAQVSWHNRTTESRTGSDFGLAIVRPRVTKAGEIVQIASGQRRGLLVQAKKGSPKGAWGKLTPNQEQLFPSFRSNGALLLYRFHARDELGPFEWHLCRRRRLDTVKRWLLEDNFPTSMNSQEIIASIGAGHFGASDQRTLDTIVPPDQRTLVIKIDWPNEEPPVSQIDTAIYPSQEQEQLLEIQIE